MVNNTVNGKKIGTAAGKDDKVKLTYASFGNRDKGQKIEIGKSDTNPLIDNLRKNGQIVEETGEYVSIKAYPGGNPNKNKEKQSEDMTH